jgi:uncharacterized membrane protein YhaH (DUF805 family)
MKFYLYVMKHYATFTGRASRAELWMFILFNVIGAALLGGVDGLIGTYHQSSNIGLLSGIWMLLHFIPAVAATIRRLHDTDRSGWWYLLGLVPLANLVLFVFTLLRGSPGPNRFGAGPAIV